MLLHYLVNCTNFSSINAISIFIKPQISAFPVTFCGPLERHKVDNVLQSDGHSVHCEWVQIKSDHMTPGTQSSHRVCNYTLHYGLNCPSECNYMLHYGHKCPSESVITRHQGLNCPSKSVITCYIIDSTVPVSLRLHTTSGTQSFQWVCHHRWHQRLNCPSKYVITFYIIDSTVPVSLSFYMTSGTQSSQRVCSYTQHQGLKCPSESVITDDIRNSIVPASL